MDLENTLMKIALVQMKMNRDLIVNLKNSLTSMEKAAENGANLIVFPELQLSPFFPQKPGYNTAKYQVTIDHDSVTKIREKSADLGILTIPNIYLKNYAYFTKLTHRWWPKTCSRFM